MSALRTIVEWVRAQTVLAILVALLVGLLAVFVIVGVSDPAWIYCFFGMEKGTEKFRILEFVGVGMGGVLLAIGATIANRRARAIEETNRGAEDGRRQERFKNAIEHLGHESDSVRMGGAYELFQLARDTEDDDLRQTVLDILCAHIRRTTGESEYREKYKSKPSEEIQSLLILLFIRKHSVFRGCEIHLRESWLNGAILNRARLQGVNLAGAWLRGAFLVRMQLQGAFLIQIQLQGAFLIGTHLQGANLVEAHLQGANLTKAQLQGVVCQRVSRLPFEEGIRERICQESDLSEVTFAGGLIREDVDSLIEGLDDEEAKELRGKLEPYIGKPASNKLSEDSGAIVGAYTKEEAERWIVEYRGATGKE